MSQNKNNKLKKQFILCLHSTSRQYEMSTKICHSSLKKENNTASEKDLTAMARTISDEDIQQIFSEQHGGIVDAISKTTDNAIFAIILDNTKSKLVLSPFVAIKDPNGIVTIIWNIKDGIMALLK